MIKGFVQVVAIITLIATVESFVINIDPNSPTLNIDDTVIQKVSSLSCDGLESVDLHGLGLDYVRSGFIKSSSIKSILLNDNNLSGISSDTFDEVPNLQCLDLSDNHLSLTELTAIRHDALRTLLFDHQRVTEMNDVPSFNTSRANFPNVERLSLKGIDYEGFHLYAFLFPKVTTIFWGDSNLAYVKSNIAAYISPSLRSVHLERNAIANFVVDDLKGVEELYLDGNPLDSLSIEYNRNLRTLSLANCGLGDNWHLSMVNLITLDLSGNGLVDVHVDTNTDDPRDDDDFQLENLSLSYNRFSTFPRLDRLARLRRLSLSYNHLERIDFVYTADSVKALSLRGNRIVEIKPHAFSKLSLLEELDLSENRLRSLTPGWVQPLIRLRHLDLRRNQFQTIWDMNIYASYSLTRVYIKGNEIRVLDNQDKYIPKNCTVYVA